MSVAVDSRTTEKWQEKVKAVIRHHLTTTPKGPADMAPDDPSLTAELHSLRTCFEDYGRNLIHPTAYRDPLEFTRAAGRVLFGLLLDAAMENGRNSDDLAADVDLIMKRHTGISTIDRALYLGLVALGELA